MPAKPGLDLSWARQRTQHKTVRCYCNVTASKRPKDHAKRLRTKIFRADLCGKRVSWTTGSTLGIEVSRDERNLIFRSKGRTRNPWSAENSCFEHAAASTLSLKLWQDQRLADPQAYSLDRVPETEHREVPDKRLREPFLAQNFSRSRFLEDVKNFPAIVLEVDGVRGCERVATAQKTSSHHLKRNGSE